jgi:tripeptidyl-peptidase-1
MIARNYVNDTGFPSIYAESPKGKMVATGLFISLVSVFTLTHASAAGRKLVLHESNELVPNGFVHNGPASPNTLLTLRVSLVSNDLPGLEKALYNVSTPDSAFYGRHLTKEEVNTYFPH